MCLYLLLLEKESRSQGTLTCSWDHHFISPSYDLAVSKWAGDSNYRLATGVTRILGRNCTSPSYDRMACQAGQGHRCGLSGLGEFCSRCHCGSGPCSWISLLSAPVAVSSSRVLSRVQALHEGFLSGCHLWHLSPPQLFDGHFWAEFVF